MHDAHVYFYLSAGKTSASQERGGSTLWDLAIFGASIIPLEDHAQREDANRWAVS